MLFTCAVSYAMSVKNFKSRSVLALFIYFTMLFNGGLVATYLLITKTLMLQNTIWVLLFPSLCNAWNILLMRNFFNGIPDSLAESAKIDGANDIVILFRIIIPISLPGIATIGLFYALSYWNEWYKCLLYIDSNHSQYYTLQYLIQRILRQGQLRREPARRGGGTQQHNASHIRLPHGYRRGIHRTDYPAVSLPAEIFCTGSHCRGGKGLSICTAGRTTEIIQMEETAAPWSTSRFGCSMTRQFYGRKAFFSVIPFSHNAEVSVLRTLLPFHTPVITRRHSRMLFKKGKEIIFSGKAQLIADFI